jgi:hypothetical protein
MRSDLQVGLASTDVHVCESEQGTCGSDKAANLKRLEAILLGYLLNDHAIAWPGGDGITVRDVLASYPRAIASGRVPGYQELQRRHPEVSEALQVLFKEL